MGGETGESQADFPQCSWQEAITSPATVAQTAGIAFTIRTCPRLSRIASARPARYGSAKYVGPDGVFLFVSTTTTLYCPRVLGQWFDGIRF